MAFPWVVHETWDDGTRGNFDSETDASSILDFPDYAELARQGFAPWQGAHALRLGLSGTATANITETGALDSMTTRHFWFPVCIGADLSLSSGNTVILFALQASSTNEVVFGVRNNSGVYELFAGETGATNTLAIVPKNNRWYEVELSVTIDTGPNDGTIDFYVDGGAVGSQITGLDQAAITDALLGAISGTAAGNAGTILIGAFMADDARIYPRKRFPEDTIWITRDLTAFIGEFEIDQATVTGTSTDAVLSVLDADIYTATGTDFSREPTIYVRNVTANDQSPAQNTPVVFRRGAYCQLTGTNPQAWISLCTTTGASTVVKSQAHYISLGQRRKKGLP